MERSEAWKPPELLACCYWDFPVKRTRRHSLLPVTVVGFMQEGWVILKWVLAPPA